jgi:phospholipase A1
MQATFFVPGTMGTELINSANEKLWPPKPSETQFGYKRVDKLMGDDVRAGPIIRKVMCFNFYEPILEYFEALGYSEGGSEKRLYLFPYDWRLDLETIADQLAAKLDEAERDGAEHIHLVAHSMGGLVCRLVLETDKYIGRAWFPKLKTFLALATPHHGAPLALARVLGLDSTLGISEADFQRLTNNPRYPSAYQLLPAPGEAACWDQNDLTIGVVDIYDSDTAQKLGLNPALMKRARFVYDSLAQGRAPEHVRYFYFAGTGHETVTRVNVQEVDGTYPAGSMAVTRTEDAGDGTVPFWSAMPHPVQKQVVVNEHTSVFKGMPFMRVFYRLMGGDLGPPLEALDLAEAARLEPVRLSIPTPIVKRGEEFELLLVPPIAATPFEGVLLLQQLREDGAPAAPPEEVSRVRYDGPRISHLRMRMPPLGSPGLYELRYEGTPSNSEPVRFAVVSFT